MSTCLDVAWRNLLHNRRHAFVASGGVGFAVLLVFMQLGFLDAARRGATLVYEDLSFDAVLVSDRYQSVAEPASIAPTRLAQARSVPGVTDTESLYILNARWINQTTKASGAIMLLGMPFEERWLGSPSLRAGAQGLARNDSVLMDAFSSADFGEISPGATAEINGRNLTVAGQFKQGMSMFSEGAAALNRNALDRIMPGASARPSVGLLKISDGADPQMVVKALREALPDDTRALTREEFIRADQEYFVAVKPVGLVFKVGAFVALLSGAVILFQVLSAEIASRLPEFATMKAMGLGDGFLHRLGIAQAAMYCLFGYIVAIFVSWGLFHLVRALSRLPMEITPVLVLQVAAMVAVLCGVSCALALRRVRRADPADLF